MSGMSRNKRKYETHSAAPYGDAADPNGGGIFPPFHADCPPAIQLFPAGCLPQEVSSAGSGFGLFSLDPPAGTYDVCRSLACGHEDDDVSAPDEWEVCEHDTDWDNQTEAQLEEILLHNLDFVYNNMVKTITSHGYSERAATAALLAASEQYGWNENVASSIAEHTLLLLKEGRESGLQPLEYPIEELQKLERAVLDKMVGLVCEAHPFFSIGDAMWCLLMCDLDVALACTLDYDPSTGFVNGDSSVTHNMKQTELNSNSGATVPAVQAENGVCVQENLTSMLPPSRCSSKSDVCRALGIPSLPSRKGVNAHSMNSSGRFSENSVVTLEQAEGAVSTLPLQVIKDVKPFVSSRKVTAVGKRDAILRQKTINLEKNLHSVGSKAVIRASKHGAFANVVLDRKSKSTLDPASINLKSSSRIGKVIAASVTQEEVSVDLSFCAGVPSSTTFESKSNGSFGAQSDSKQKQSIRGAFETKPNICLSAPPVANTELSLSLPTTSIESVVAKQDVKDDESNTSNTNSIFASGNTSDSWTPQDKIDEMALKLVPRVRELQAQLQDWSDWAQQKVVQAARRLGKEKEELCSLRQDKEEVGRLQEERKTLEESTRKKLTEMESAISKATCQVERANAESRRLELENSQLRLEMEAAKLQAEQSAANCRDLSQKQLKSLKNFQLWDSQKAQLQEEMAIEKSKLSRINQQVEQAKELHEQVQSKLRKEERSRDEAIARVNIERREREQIETSARSQENSILVSMENDVQRYKNEIRCLEQQVTKLKMLDSSNMIAPRWCPDKSYTSRLSERQKSAISPVQAYVMVFQESDYDDIQRERECVMCLNAEMSVVFLPCAHQVVCADCNVLHEKQGMKDCPSCRTPIHRRICARTSQA